MTLRELPTNPTSQMLVLYALSLAALGAAPVLLRCGAGAVPPEAARVTARTEGLGTIAQWVCAHSAGVFSALALVSLAALGMTITRARSREANIRGLAVLSVVNCLFSVALMGLVLAAALHR